ncbi:MAG: hypothetical protein AB7I19_18445 [Planctomycetota bacterium]
MPQPAVQAPTTPSARHPQTAADRSSVTDVRGPQSAMRESPDPLVATDRYRLTMPFVDRI